MGIFSKPLSKIPAVVARGAKDARKGKQSIPAAAFAQKGRDAQKKKDR